MRCFIIISLLVYVYADKLSPNYRPISHPVIGLSFPPGATETPIQYLRNPPNRYVAQSNPSSSDSNSKFTYNSPAEVEKEFYSFSAPDEEFNDVTAVQRALSTVKQGLRVVFIKGPENKAFEDAVIALAKQAAQQQTAIYVLNKQNDIGELANRFNAVGRNTHKPQVHYVKYRTAEDAVNAQKAIQSQYDSLGGKSLNINGGIAPVLNFASQSEKSASNAQIPTQEYLPSSVFRLRL